MALIPLWIPVVITLLAFLWIVILGRFLPGPFDDVAVFMIMVGTWLVYGVSKTAESFFTNLASGNVVTILIALALITAVYLLIKFKK